MTKVGLTLPATSEYLSMVRYHVGAAATHIDMTIDDVQDLQIATEELCLSLLRPWANEEAQLRLDISWDEDCVEVRCHLIDARLVDAGPPDSRSLGLPHELSTRMLDTLTDAHGVSTSDGVQVAWLHKQRGGA